MEGRDPGEGQGEEEEEETHTLVPLLDMHTALAAAGQAWPLAGKQGGGEGHQAALLGREPG